MSKIRLQSKDAFGLLDYVFDLPYFHPNKAGVTPIPYHWSLAPKSNLVVVVGENASGKSFFRRLVTMVARKADIEPMPISMEGRKSTYLASFVYGDEQWQATGQCSVNTVLTGIRTCRSRGHPHMIFWDAGPGAL